MPITHYYGRKNLFRGKRLFEILANLRDFGVGRMLVRQMELLDNKGKKCYYIVKKVEPVMDKELKEGAIYAERVYNGAKVPDLVFIDEESWYDDWQLVHRNEEHLHRVPPEELIEHGQGDTVQVLPRWMQVPPLMDLFLRRHYRQRRGVTLAPVKLDRQPIEIMMHYDFGKINEPHQLHRIAEEGEESEFNWNKPMKTMLAEQFRPTPESIAETLKRFAENPVDQQVLDDQNAPSKAG